MPKVVLVLNEQLSEIFQQARGAGQIVNQSDPSPAIHCTPTIRRPADFLRPCVAVLLLFLAALGAISGSSVGFPGKSIAGPLASGGQAHRAGGVQFRYSTVRTTHRAATIAEQQETSEKSWKGSGDTGLHIQVSSLLAAPKIEETHRWIDAAGALDVVLGYSTRAPPAAV